MWVERAALPSDTVQSRWFRVDGSGRLTGMLMLAPEDSLVGLNNGTALVARRDADSPPALEMRRLKPVGL